MTTFYIDPDTTQSPQDGTIGYPYDGYVSYLAGEGVNKPATGTTLLWKRDTTDIMTGLNPAQLTTNVSDLTYGAYGEGDHPILTWYETSTSTGDWSPHPTVSNVWIYQNTNYTLPWRRFLPVGFGTPGIMFERVDFFGQRSGSPQSFSSFGQWDTTSGDKWTVNDPGGGYITLAIYNDQNPVTEWGTIYFFQESLGPFNFSTATNIEVSGLEFRHCAVGPQLNNSAVGILFSDNKVTKCYHGIKAGANSTLSTDIKILNNEITGSSTTGIFLWGHYLSDVLVEGNTVIDTGKYESIAGIYVSQTDPAVNTTPKIIQNNVVDTVRYGPFWDDGDAFYADSEADNVIFRYNLAKNCTDHADLTFQRASAGFRTNSGGANQQFYGNVSDNCFYGFNSSNSTSTIDREEYVYNNTFLNCSGQACIFRTPDAGADQMVFKNNLGDNDTVLSPGDDQYAISYFNSTEDQTDSGYNKMSDYTTFAENDTPGSGSSLEADLKIDPTTYELASDSPAVGSGIKWWGDGPRPHGVNGEPFPDTNPDIGGAQSKWDDNHPSRL